MRGYNKSEGPSRKLPSDMLFVFEKKGEAISNLLFVTSRFLFALCSFPIGI